MSYPLHLKSFVSREFPLDFVQETCISLCAVVLPFRLNLSGLSRFELFGSRFEIITYNPKIRKGIDGLPKRSERTQVNTRLCLVDKLCPVRPMATPSMTGKSVPELLADCSIVLESCKRADIESQANTLMAIPDVEFNTRIIQGFLEIYSSVSPKRFNGDQLRFITPHDVYENHIVLGSIWARDGVDIPNSFFRKVLSARNPRLDELDFWYALAPKVEPLVDLKLRKVLSIRQPFLSEKLLLFNRSFENDHNIEMSVITAVAGLEAALSLFASKKVANIVGAELTNSLLKEAGVTLSIEFLSKAFAKDPPMPDLISDAKKVITARNKIMHGIHDKSGKPSFYNIPPLGKEIRACQKLTIYFIEQST